MARRRRDYSKPIQIGDGAFVMPMPPMSDKDRKVATAKAYASLVRLAEALAQQAAREDHEAMMADRRNVGREKQR